MSVVLGELSEMGFDAQWGVFSARDVGSTHLRKRVFILAYSTEWQSR
jgi:DNA (cytosine-5)-methyltransferase 1